MTAEKKPPSPAKDRMPRYVNQTVIECVYSMDCYHRAVLARDSNGNVRIHCESWDLSEWEACGAAFWSPLGKSETITDTVENARSLARESLREVGAKMESATSNLRGSGP